jgi:hypothetical protein
VLQEDAGHAILQTSAGCAANLSTMCYSGPCPTQHLRWAGWFGFIRSGCPQSGLSYAMSGPMPNSLIPPHPLFLSTLPLSRAPLSGAPLPDAAPPTLLCQMPRHRPSSAGCHAARIQRRVHPKSPTDCHARAAADLNRLCLIRWQRFITQG